MDRHRCSDGVDSILFFRWTFYSILEYQVRAHYSSTIHEQCSNQDPPWLSVVLRPVFVESRAARAFCIMQSYASFSEYGYEFDEQRRMRMATSVAQMRMPLGDVLELIARLNEEEGRVKGPRRRCSECEMRAR